MNIETRLDEVRSEYQRRITQGGNELLRQVGAHIASFGGKMLRPRMLLLAADTLGQAHTRRSLLLAVCIEMLHNASLLHDDVIDRADTRRGQPSINRRWNNAVAVLAGDYLLAQVMHLLDEVNDAEATRQVNRTVISMVESEMLQQELQTKDYQPETYLSIIDGKTANLFALAAELGNPAYRDYGLHYGRLFQLRDDVADGEDNVFTADLIASEEAVLKEMPLQLYKI